MMLFSVIYDFDCPPETPVAAAYPPDWRKNWALTECNLSDYDAGEGKSAPERWKHRKVCALLTKEQFNEFLEHIGMHAEDVETMGSLGAPGFGFGWAPAISFTHDPYGYSEFYANAYVTPIPEVEREEGFTERDWERLRKVIIQMYGLR